MRINDSFEIIEALLDKFNLSNEEYLSYFDDTSSDIVDEKVKNMNDFVSSRYSFVTRANLEELVIEVMLTVPSRPPSEKLHSHHIKATDYSVLDFHPKKIIHDFIIYHSTGKVFMDTVYGMMLQDTTTMVSFEKEEDYQKFTLFY